MEEKMTIEEWVQKDREEKRELFGEIGLHDDCVHYGKQSGKPFCNACSYWKDGNNSRKAKKLQCEKNMCYFYEPKRRGNTND